MAPNLNYKTRKATSKHFRSKIVVYAKYANFRFEVCFYNKELLHLLLFLVDLYDFGFFGQNIPLKLGFSFTLQTILQEEKSLLQLLS